MDATRAELEYTAEVCAAAIEEGATTINIPDTVGYTTPEEYTAYLEGLYRLIPELKDVIVSTHCHDDLGLAVANSYAGALAGARQIECAINGIGERAGNASLEEIVMLLATRGDISGLHTTVVTKELARTSRLVSRLTGYVVQPNKAIVGRNAFAHESGIHQDGVIKERTTYEIMDATTVGLDANSLVLGKHSGRAALKQTLAELGFTVEGAALNTAFKRFKEIADKKKQVTAMDLEALVTDDLRNELGSYTFDSFMVAAASGREPHADVTVTLPDGEVATATGTGDGPIDSVFAAINAATGIDAQLRVFRVDAVTGGQDALGESSVVLEYEGQSASGQGVATDIIEAAGTAYVRALSNVVRKAQAVAQLDRRRRQRAGRDAVGRPPARVRRSIERRPRNRDRGRRAAQVLRRRSRPCAGVSLHVQPRRDLRLPRAQRRGQDDDRRDPRGLSPRDAGEVRVLGVDPAHGDRAWRARIGMVLQEGRAQPNLTRARDARAVVGLLPAPQAGRRDDRARRPGGEGRRARRAAVGRPAPAPGRRPRARRRSRADLPRRADDRLRSGGAPRRLEGHRRPARPRQDGLPHDALPRRGAGARRPRGDHQGRRDRRRGPAGRARVGLGGDARSRSSPPAGVDAERAARRAGDQASSAASRCCATELPTRVLAELCGWAAGRGHRARAPRR